MGLSNHKKLLAYSGSASIFLLCNSVQSQVVYTDIDPDKNIYGNGVFDIDINDDGIVDIQFTGGNFFTWTTFSGSGSGFSTQIFSIMNFISVAYNDDFSYLRPFMFSVGDDIDNSKPFTNFESMQFFSAHNDFGDGFDSDVTIYTGSEHVDIDSYLGIKLIIGGEPHYGWIRLNLIQMGESMPYLSIKDYAFNNIPNEPIEIIQYTASEATELVLTDIGETNTAADLQLNFEKALDESTVSSYRIILYTGGITPTLAEANTLSPEKYTEIFPTGIDISFIFNEETRDINGNLLLPETNYRAIVLSVADGITVTNNSLSPQSTYCSYKFVNAHSVYDVDLTDIGNNKNITDLNIQFDITSLIGVNEFRVFLSNDEEPNIETLLSLDSNFYKTIETAGLSYSLILDTTKNIFSCLTPHLFERYYASVISMPDGIFSTYPSLELYPGVATFLHPDYDETPNITISNLSGTATDINVQFPKFNFEEDIDAYRIVVVKDEFYYLFQNTDVEDLPSFKYIDVIPAGINLNINLSSSLKDTDGNNIVPGIAYRVIVFLKGSSSPEYFSKATPSDPFILTEPVAIETNLDDQSIFLENNILFIQLANNIEQNLIIVNAMGQEVFRENISTENKSIDLNFLTSGIYFCFFEFNSSTQVLPITLH